MESLAERQCIPRRGDVPPLTPEQLAPLVAPFGHAQSDARATTLTPVLRVGAMATPGLHVLEVQNYGEILDVFSRAWHARARKSGSVLESERK